MRPICAEIDLAALKHNAQLARQKSNNAALMAVVKANAYGHGAVEVATALNTIADEFGVASIEDAVELRSQGIEKPITALSVYLSEDVLDAAVKHNVDIVIYDESHLSLLKQSTLALNVWIKFDTGMGRLGFNLSKSKAILEEIDSIESVSVRGIMSHFSNADVPVDAKNQQQLESFELVIKEFKATILANRNATMANSAATMSELASSYDLVRAGIMLYGASPIDGVSAESLNLKPVMTLRSRLISVKTIGAGASVGYAGSWVASEDMLVGVIACGYGDGYPRCVPEKTEVLIGGVRVPIIGRVSMDLISVDLRKVQSARVGDEVVLWGEGLPIEGLAEKMNTITYELLCGVAPRVKRKYL